jgi:hypothetical protein
MKRERLDRIKAVEREYEVAKTATEMLDEALKSNPSLLGRAKLSPADAQNLSENLEATYLLRLYAEFEAGLRDAWKNHFKRSRSPPMKALLNAVAAKCSVPEDDLDNAHAVRKYRNSLVHEEGEEAQTITLARARGFLCTFFGRLPLKW